MAIKATVDSRISNVYNDIWDNYNDIYSKLQTMFNLPTDKTSKLTGITCALVVANIQKSSNFFTNLFGTKSVDIKDVLSVLLGPFIFQEQLEGNKFFKVNIKSSSGTQTMPPTGEDRNGENIIDVYNALKIAVGHVSGAMDGDDGYDLIKDALEITSSKTEFLYTKQTDAIKNLVLDKRNAILEDRDRILKLEKTNVISPIKGCIRDLKVEIQNNKAFCIGRDLTAKYIIIFDYDTSLKAFTIWDPTDPNNCWKLSEKELIEKLGTNFVFLNAKNIDDGKTYAAVNSEARNQQIAQYGASCLPSTSEGISTFNASAIIVSNPDIPKATIYTNYGNDSLIKGIQFAKGWLENVLSLRYIWGGGHYSTVKEFTIKLEHLNNTLMLIKGPSVSASNIMSTPMPSVEIHNGFDCSGGIIYVLTKVLGHKIYGFFNTDGIQSHLTIKEVTIDELQTGDIGLVPTTDSRWKFIHVFSLFHSKDIQPGGEYKKLTDIKQLYVMNASGSYYPDPNNIKKTIRFQGADVSFGINTVFPFMTSKYKNIAKFYRFNWDKIEAGVASNGTQLSK